MVSIESQLKDLRDLLKNKIENKFNTTCSSTTIIGLIAELNNNIGNELITFDTYPTNLANKIYKTGEYLAQVLNTAGITANSTDGFTTLINKIDTIQLLVTPSISISRSASSVTKGDNFTISGYVTGENNIIPTGYVELYRDSVLSPIDTKSLTYNTYAGEYSFSISSSNLTVANHYFRVKYLGDNNYGTIQSNDAKVRVTNPKTDDNVTLSINGTKTYGNTLTVSATGTGTIKLGTSKGGTEIGTVTSGGSKSWKPDAGTYTVYAISAGSSTVNSGTASETVTIGKASGFINIIGAGERYNVGEYAGITINTAGHAKVSLNGTTIDEGNNTFDFEYQGTSAGTYTFWVYSDGDGNHYGTSQSFNIYFS